MEKLKELLKKLNLKVAIVGGALVVTTTLGTCQLMGSDEITPAEEPAAPAPATVPEEVSPEEAAK
jgi:hypothetical protein|tara:strand:- start:7940 stop:8134 length:195 start_codon:yes stop_codon:yes gene_type:complete